VSAENRQLVALVVGMLAFAALVVGTITLMASAAADGGVERECSTLTECD
jgi:hypothetical protein